MSSSVEKSINSLAVSTGKIAAGAVTLAKLAGSMIVLSSESYADTDDTKIATLKAAKAYIDAQITTVSATRSLGTPTIVDSNGDALNIPGGSYQNRSIYKVESDGFILVSHRGGNVKIYVGFGASNPPTISYGDGFSGFSETAWQSCCIPIKEDYYFFVNAVEAATLTWIPMGTGDCVYQSGAAPAL